MVVVELGEKEGEGGMKRSTSFAGTVDISLALHESRMCSDVETGWKTLALPGFYGALGGLAMSVRQPWAICAAGLVLLMTAGPQAVSSTYTLWNWTALLGQIADLCLRPWAPPRLLPYLLVNSWAIFTSFNIMALVHPTHYMELAKRIDAGMCYFHYLNTVGHFVPGVLALLWFQRLDAPSRTHACEWSHLVSLKYASLAYHLLWALRVAGGLNLNGVYLKRPKCQWYVAWATAALTHVAVGAWVQDMCLDPNKPVFDIAAFDDAVRRSH